MGKSLDELSSYMKPLAQQLIANCTAANIPVVVIDTGRTVIEQRQKVVEGVSWTQNSRHLPQPPEGLSEAIDIAPVSIIAAAALFPNWQPTNPLWEKVGEIGEALGLRWGGRWSGIKRDPSHFEYIHPKEITKNV